MNTKLNFNVVFISNLILTLNVKTGKLLTTTGEIFGFRCSILIVRLLIRFMLNEAWNLFPYSEILSDIHGHLKKNLPLSELNPLNRNPPFLHSTLTHSAVLPTIQLFLILKLEVASHDKIVSIILLTCNPDGLLRNDKVMMGQVHVHARRRTALEYRCWCESGQLVWRREARS